MNDTIALLAREKDFAALNAAERSLVLMEMTQSEFEHLRAILLAATQLDANAQPSARLKADLLKKMSEKTRPGPLKYLVEAQMPVWLAVVALAAVLAAGRFFVNNTVLEKPIREVQWRTDTLWQVKTVWRDRVIWRKKLIYKEIPVVEPFAAIPENSNLQAMKPEANMMEFKTPKLGTSLADTPELMRFFTQGDQ